MKRLSLILLVTGSVMLQGQVILNRSFEQSKDGVYGNNCYIGTTATDWFTHCSNWRSWYHKDDRCFPTVYTHSPDWVGSETCMDAWDGKLCAGMGSDELIQQEFAGALEDGECYEMRIKFKPVIWQNYEKNDWNLDVVFSRDHVAYKKDDYWYNDPINGECSTCHPDYGKYIQPFVWSDYKTLLSLPVGAPVDAFLSGQYSFPNTYPYKGYYELHQRFPVKQANFPYNLETYKWITLDFRKKTSPYFCGSMYSEIDYIELFKVCPLFYHIDGVIISGVQERYETKGTIAAGKIAKGNVIIASNGNTSFHATRFVMLQPGFYADFGAVLEVDNTGCTSCRFEKQASVAEEQPLAASLSESLIELAPNPASDYAKLQSVNALKLIVLSDVSGRTIKTIYPDGNTLILPLQDLSTGVYLLKCTDTSGKTEVKKLVIEK